MGIGKRIVKKSALVILPLTLLSFAVNWEAENLRFLRIFGNPVFVPVSIVIGGLLGLANINGLIWSLERLLGSSRANAKLVFVSMFRLLILFAVIIALTALKLINFLGLLTGMLVVFLVLIREAVHQAERQ
ncbi:MAG TPA: hypothetical protein VEI96_03315 [Thermodesulfovibrionales bacterium]|nr:hypothetical protein [Thermodesulfovibrionales bacterium]